MKAVLAAPALALALALSAPPTGAAIAADSSVVRYSDLRSGPFDAARDAAGDVDAALLTARATRKSAIIVLGGDWCHDSRAFADLLKDAAVRELIEGRFVVVFVDVGRRDRNLDIPARWGVARLEGTPTVLVVSPDGRLRNAATRSAWTSAANRSASDALAYFSAFAAAPETRLPDDPSPAD